MPKCVINVQELQNFMAKIWINLKINIFLPEEIWRCTFSFSLSFFFNTILGMNFGDGSFFLPFWTWYRVKSCKILTPFTHYALCRTADWQCLIYLTKKPLWFDEKNLLADLFCLLLFLINQLLFLPFWP